MLFHVVLLVMRMLTILMPKMVSCRLALHCVQTSLTRSQGEQAMEQLNYSLIKNRAW